MRCPHVQRTSCNCKLSKNTMQKSTLQPKFIRFACPSIQRRFSSRSTPDCNPSLVTRASTDRQSTTTLINQIETITDKPQWTGDSILSQAVNAAINFPPLFGIMKMGARAAIKGTAEKRGVPWAENVKTLESSEVYTIKEEIEDASLSYPWYYTQPFHGYDEGNLNWQAAFEVEPATQAMALRVWKDETTISPLEAQTRLRRGIFNDIHAFYLRHNLTPPQRILDIGCSVGVSTQWIAEEWVNAQVTGLDLSPYFLAVAELRERQRDARLQAAPSTASRAENVPSSRWRSRHRITYVHGNMEQTGMEEGSFDLITVQFVIHECPAQVIRNVIAEASRVLRPGGVLAFSDNNPASKVIQGTRHIRRCTLNLHFTLLIACD